MKKIKFTAAEKKYINLLGADKLIQIWKENGNGNGGNTVGDMYSYEANQAFERLGLSERITPNRYTSFGDCIMNAGEKLSSQL